MINVSNEYKKVLSDNDRAFYGNVEITFADNTVLNLDDSRIISFKIDDATSVNGRFIIGAAEINRLTLTIRNEDELFSDYDFTDAIIRPSTELQLSETVEAVQKGVFIAEDPKFKSSTITITALDNISKFDTEFSNVSIAFPTTAQALLNAVCNHCGVILGTFTFHNDNYTIQSRPEDTAITCREIVAWIGQISGNFARCNISGVLELKWYDVEAFSDYVDGGAFDTSTPYASGDSSDGGNFTNYASGDSVDGGKFIEQKRYHHLYALSNLTISTDDVVITGVQVTDSAEEPTTVLFGQGGYVISIEGNKLIQTATDANNVASMVGSKIVGMRFRPLNLSAISNPTIEAGDVAYVSDKKGNTYQTLITNTTYAIGRNQSVSCDAETPARNSSKRFSADTKAIVEARKYTQQKLDAYDLMVQQLNNLVSHSFGVYKTAQEQEDGSVIYYMHDKPTLAESVKIWKQTADAFAVSTNGGQTYTAGFDVNGNAVVNVLSAIGINADWLNVGKIRSTSGKVLIDMEKGVANSDNISMTDNVADGFPLSIPFYIDGNASIISSILLNFTIMKFRTYSTTAASGGGSTQTSGSGGGANVTSGDIYGSSSTVGSTTGTSIPSGSSHVHAYDYTVDTLYHSHSIQIPNHQHDVSTPSHVHSLNFGIMETNVVHNLITIRIDGVDRTSVNDLQGIIDLTQWITTTGWHTIELYSATLKRISAQLNIKSYIQM